MVEDVGEEGIDDDCEGDGGAEEKEGIGFVKIIVMIM